ncbi:MAG: hypothetical protein KatS3mg122_0598 [Caldimonas sp.]|uniref:Wzz/FepE/Etk N-terminal domain-containing protein n=1 Tax=Caldimonas taiwanensis TaxID=307483 RepID=UPI000A04667A|nr:Wzz/FepE/Etk N-terminal domain-containing protein [Caldimonas taiwanensis]GIX23367.1 MAG: hypothetical protein KatS3mg122_0598 [Caldimonas sp.]
MPQLTPLQYLRMIWARKWLVLAVFVTVATAGIATVLSLPKQYTAEARLVVDMRPDPVLGGLAAPFSMATELEVLRSDVVAARVVKALGMLDDPKVIQDWREKTDAKMPLDRYLAGFIQRSMTVEPVRGSNVIAVKFSHGEPAVAAAAANALAQAAIDVSVEMRVGPARQSASWFEDQARALRNELEAAQARLSKFQQQAGIVVTDERLDQETARLNALTAELALAQAERLDALGRQRNAGEMSPDILQSAQVQAIRGQLTAAETRLSEISRNLGTNHPQRIQIEAQIAELRQQLNAEMQRVSGSVTVASRASAQKVEALRAMVEAQKRKLLEMRSARDQIAVLMRDVETAQRAYDTVSQRSSLLNIESQSSQSVLRLLSPAVEPLEYTSRKIKLGILGAIMGGLMLAIAMAIGIELLDRRVRGEEDLAGIDGAQLIGVLGDSATARPLRRLASTGGPSTRPALPMSGAGG